MLGKQRKIMGDTYMPPEERTTSAVPDDSALKMVTSFFAGIILAGLGSFFAYPHDLPTKADMEQMQIQTQKELDSLQAEQSLQENEMTSMRISMGKIAYKLNIQIEP